MSFSLAQDHEVNKEKFNLMLYTVAMSLLAFKNITDSSHIMVKPDFMDDLIIVLFTALIGIKLYSQKYTYKKVIFSIIIFATSRQSAG